ncbi:MAG TPA: hypothetical protein ENG03_04940 [Thioploca sp.]|nr:MAG: hypothetical protein B6247_24480 [Beggiatoa sp. 4572_84]RKZ62902.1 MAG: hypothetical protein DRR08_04785 [Gammaproteobacteria bacterium]HDN26431.1 hypothetical protein [Thioploca sp.]
MKMLYSLLLLVVLVGCGGTRAIYGVPEEQWNLMKEQERQAAIERFKRQEEINAQTRAQAKKAREDADEFANKCHETDDEVDLSDSSESDCEVITRRKWLFW